MFKKTRNPVRRFARFLALVALLFALYAVDFIHLTWAETARAAPLVLFLVVLLDSAVVAVFASRLATCCWRLVGIVFLLFYGLKTFLVGIEAVYLTDVLPGHLTRPTTARLPNDRVPFLAYPTVGY